MSASSFTVADIPSQSLSHSRRNHRGHTRSGYQAPPPTDKPTTLPNEHEQHDQIKDPAVWSNGVPVEEKQSALEGPGPELHGHGHSHSLPPPSSHSHGHGHALTNSISYGHNHAYSHSGAHSVSGLEVTPNGHTESQVRSWKGTEVDAYATPFQSADRTRSASEEIVAGVVLTLPWVALSWYTRPHTASEELESEFSTTYAQQGEAEYLWWRTLVLVSLTLLFMGVVGLVHRQRAGQALSSIQLSTASFRICGLRVASLALPIYAGIAVGGPVVALALALAGAAGIPNLVERQGANRKPLQRLKEKKSSLLVLVLLVVLNLAGYGRSIDLRPLFGFLALLLSIFAVRPPYSASGEATFAQTGIAPVSKFIATLTSNPLVASPDDIQTTLFSGGVLAILALVLSPSNGTLSLSSLVLTLFTASLFGMSLAVSPPSTLQTRQKFGFVAASASVILCSGVPYAESSRFSRFAWIVIAVLGYLAAISDSPQTRSSHHHRDELSAATNFLLRYGESIPILHSILIEDDSRRIFYFMALNFSFMLVQLMYGFLTGSLGLLSDSIHMFFDCIALVVGLSAAVMSKWPPSARFPYGYGKVDKLSGFANGVFLMIISVEIVYEAIERLISGAEMHRIQELLIVSIAGLAVNLVGIVAFDHGHTHGHGGHEHGHDHGNENMHGIFLHILADTLGSVAVVISTILVHYYGWSGFDPLASCIIAILIFVSAVPLVSSTAQSLLLTIPADVEYHLRETLGGVTNLNGVVGYTVPKFWLDDTANHDHHHHHHHHHHHDHHHNHDHHHHHHHHHHSHDHDSHHGHNKPSEVLGVIHIIASRTADLEDVRRRTVSYLRDKNLDVVVQVEREGEGRCWCGTGSKGSSYIR